MIKYFFIGIIHFLIVNSAPNNICSQALYDVNLGIYQCGNCSLVTDILHCGSSDCQELYYYSIQSSSCMYYCGKGQIAQNQQSCSSSDVCIYKFQWNYTTNQCQRQLGCNQGIFDQNFNIFQCQNCSLVTNTQFCQNNCKELQYYNYQYYNCFSYCGYGKIQNLNLICFHQAAGSDCVQGFQLVAQNYIIQCIKQQTCIEQQFGYYLNMFQCTNCSLVLDTQLCSNNCLNQQFYSSQNNQCMTYCGNGLVTFLDQASCKGSKLCIDGYQWSFTLNACILKLTCNQSLIDSVLNITQCSNCSLVSNILFCQNNCLNFEYYSQQFNQCMTYWGNGIITNQGGPIFESNYCIDGFQWSILDQKCIKKQLCTQALFDQSLNLYQCEFCSLISNIKNCQKGCLSSQYYSLQFGGCFEYCKDGLIAKKYYECVYLTSQICVDGFQWNGLKNKCEKIICSINIDQSDTQNYLLQQCPNCSYITNIQYCQNSCSTSPLPSYYYQQQQICMVYCGKGRIAFDQTKCLTSKICIDGFQWSDQDNICKYQQVNCSSPSPDKYVQQCPNCSLVINIDFCQNTCYSLQYYDIQQQKCMVYCGNGLIAQDQMDCQQSKICIDGYTYTSQGKCIPISQNQNNNQDATQSNSSSNQNASNNSKADQNLLVLYITIPLFVILIIIIITVCFALVKKYKNGIQMYNQVNQNIQNQLEGVNNNLQDQIFRQQEEIMALTNKMNQFLNTQINQIDFEINQNKDQQDLPESESQITIKALMKYDNQNKQYFQQNFELIPTLKNQTTQ